MKKFLKLVFWGIVIYAGWNYVDKNDIDVKAYLSKGVEWITEQIEEMKSPTPANAEPKEESAQYSNSTPSNHPDYRDYQAADANRSSGNVERSGYNNTDGNEAQLVSSNTKSNARTGNYEDTRHKEATASEREVAFKSLEGELPANNSEWVQAVTMKYSPSSWNLLMQYDGLPRYSEATLADGSVTSSNKPVGTFHFLTGDSKSELLSSMGTNVHEIAHAYFSQNAYKYANENKLLLDWDKAEGYIYISPSKYYFISFPEESLFASRELVSVIPENLRTFRFDSYIDGNTSTQSEGVIGLLNELHAYHLGSKYDYDMLDAYQNAEQSDAQGLFMWVRNSMSSMTAYYEFNFFIKEYLLYMKSLHPADYAALKSNSSFKNAYRSICSSYEDLIISYQQTIKSEMQRLNASGNAEISIEGNTIWVKTGNSNSSKGSSIFGEDRVKLMEVLASGRYARIESDF